MLKAIALALALAVGTGAASAAQVGDDGLHKEDWFTITFRDMREDIETAAEQGKRLAIIFEQRGCIYCRKLHEEVLSDPQVRDYIRENYMVVQYNLFGDEEVTDLDGDVLTEKTAARKWGVVFTPTVIFLPEEPSDEPANRAAVQTMPGQFGKLTTLNMFRWVREKGYEGQEHFQSYHARKIEEARASGAVLAD